MKPVWQTRFGGPAAPPDQRGNCGQAALASALEIPLEDALDINAFPDETWWDELQVWLGRRGLALLYMKVPDYLPGGLTGHHLAEVLHPSGIPHVVVWRDVWTNIVHDPLGKVADEYHYTGLYIFIPVEVSAHKAVTP